MTFYSRYIQLCNEAGKAPSRVVQDIGLSKTSAHFWKAGKTSPTDATLQKLADYFGVSVEYISGAEEIKKEPTEKSGEPDENLQKLIELYSLLPEAERSAYILALETGLKSRGLIQ